MFIDFLTLVMINMVAGTTLLAYYIWKGLDAEDQRPYAAAFGMVGLLALILGLRLAFTWPLPGSYNVGYSDATTLFGIVFLATGFAIAMGWDLLPVSIYGFFAGIDAVIVGARIWSLQLGKEPLVAAIGFVLAGLGGVFSYPFLKWFRDNKTVRWIAILMLLATALIWAATFYGALWSHLESFSKWVPATMAQ
jgi:putative membrane protein